MAEALAPVILLTSFLPRHRPVYQLEVDPPYCWLNRVCEGICFIRMLLFPLHARPEDVEDTSRALPLPAVRFGDNYKFAVRCRAALIRYDVTLEAHEMKFHTIYKISLPYRPKRRLCFM